MKVITIRQPWATLIALGEKRFETRSWRTKYREKIAIHAGKNIDKAACQQEPIRSVLAKHGYNSENLPTGVILATCKLSDCLKVTENLAMAAFLDNHEMVTDNEYYFGDFSEGRYAWELQDIQALKNSIPAKGQLSLWEYPVEK